LKERNIEVRKILMLGAAATVIALGGAQAYADDWRATARDLTPPDSMVEDRAASTGADPYYSDGFGADDTWADVGMAADTSGDYSDYY
jgi:hypothetical protein